MAVEAGADIVMEIGPTEMPITAIDAIMAAVADETITLARIDESVSRVLALKCRYGLLDDPTVDPAATATEVGTAENVATGRELSRRGVTLVRNRGVLPFDADDGSTTLVAGMTHVGTVIPTPPLSHVPSLATKVASVSDGPVLTWSADASQNNSIAAIANILDEILAFKRAHSLSQGLV